MPYEEYLGQCSLPVLRDRIVEDDIRPTMTQYAEDLWRDDPVFSVCQKVLQQCFQAVPQLRGDIVDIHNELVMLTLTHRPLLSEWLLLNDREMKGIPLRI